MFTKQFDKYTCVGDTRTCEVDGFTCVARIADDNDYGTPWDNEDGHGPVSEWTRRDKASGERVLCEDRGLKRFYDFAEAVKLARRDGWGSGPDVPGETAGQKAQRAAEADYQAMRAWCNDEWRYVGVVVAVYQGEPEEGAELASESLWGIDCNHPNGDNSYLAEVANDLLSQAMPQAVAARATQTAPSTTKPARPAQHEGS